MRDRFAWLFLVAAAAGCLPVAPVPTTQQVLIAQRTWPTATARDLERGRIQYLERCAGCHMPYRPGRFPADLWPRLVADMRHNANLVRSEDEQDIVRYLASASQAQRETPLRSAR